MPSSRSADNFFFGEFAVAEAAGVLLAHSLQTPQIKLRKGHLLTADDIALLQAAGIASITGARPGPEDIAENPAASHVAALLAGKHTSTRAATGGRCNLHATEDGIVVIDTERVIRANLLGEAIAIGTLPPWSQVRKGQVIATVKIIPAAISRQMLNACSETLASPGPTLRVAPLQPRRAALIVSHLALPARGQQDSASKVSAVSRQRLAAVHSRLALELHCAHEVDAIAAALRQARAAGCNLFLISGAAGTKDRQDLVPRAIVAAGGSIERFGTPMEPGNMLLLARLDDLPVLVLPGCARSRRLNGLDWVLQRLVADLPLDAEAFARMGIGGLIRQPTGAYRETPESAQSTQAPNIAALILAAGASQRMGDRHKLLLEIEGIPLVQRAVNAALASRASSVTLITGKCSEEISASLDPAPARLRLIHNPDYASGMASSLTLGIRQLPENTDAVLVLLADMPYLNAAHLDQLIAAYEACTQQPAQAPIAPIVVPTHAGQRGNPLLWPRHFFPQILSLTGDQGARSLLQQHAESILSLEINSPAILQDVDTPQDFINLSGSDKKTPGLP
jgi:molybdenum cofactor cytidylyltransferase